MPRLDDLTHLTKDTQIISGAANAVVASTDHMETGYDLGRAQRPLYLVLAVNRAHTTTGAVITPRFVVADDEAFATNKTTLITMEPLSSGEAVYQYYALPKSSDYRDFARVEFALNATAADGGAKGLKVNCFITSDLDNYKDYEDASQRDYTIR